MGIFQRQPEVQPEVEIQGEFGYFGLASWWTTLFTKTQQAHMEECFQVPELPSDARPLTTGRKQLSFRSAGALLAALAGSLRDDVNDRALAMQILAEAERRAKTEDDLLGLHITYQEMIRLHCRWRKQFLESVDLLFGACHKQIAIGPEVARMLHELHPRRVLPIHAGFQMMAILLEKQEWYAKAIEICKQARFQGWSGNWTWRIGVLAKKHAAQDNPVQNISSSGLTAL
jgi:hypothetical protein